MHPKPLFSTDHKPGSSQVCEMSRNGRLRKFKCIVQMTHAHLTTGKQIEQTKTHRVSAGFK